MNLGTIATIAYGILALVGGIIGYVQAKSKISLVSGTISGILLLVAAFIYLQGQVLGLTLAAAVSAILIVTFVIRLIKTRKMMPAGLMILAGIPTLALLLVQLG
ncbi:hypothetical protein IQ249_09280 [Lusitaniella coriacea LEGE 07157]|uniref:Small integral membrane protein n=1 Tax=Lusitaniella coriacea LEGE 07157 TaxID=945747 RepID=A0A8J7JA75_9CYAN|nr:TMEM14 family protein [Lusitaniella coriacea]MBE9116085.1 hypothetical protein [Lusitaniella coriacea LEGE 07157]